MKKFSICFIIAILFSFLCFLAGIYALDTDKKPAAKAVPEKTFEAAADQNKTTAREQYYLVAEDGFLLVFCRDKTTVCLYTHMPIMDFPENEQQKLRKGIWFNSMIDIFNYLESYSS